MDDINIKQAEIAYARTTQSSSLEIGERHHKLVGSFINNLYKNNNETISVLDVGCGKGTVRKFIIGNYFGIDPIELPECMEYQFKRCTFKSSNFKDNTFDVILIKDGINYYTDLSDIMSEIARIIKPTGTAVFTEYVDKNYSELLFHFKKLMKFRFGLMKNSWDKTYLNYYSHKDIINSSGKYFEYYSYEFNPGENRYFVVVSKPKI